MKKYVVKFNKGQASYKTRDPKKAVELCREVCGSIYTYAIDNQKNR